MPEVNVLSVNPGKNTPEEKIAQPTTSATAAAMAPQSGPNNMEKVAIAKKPKSILIKVVWMAKM